MQGMSLNDQTKGGEEVLERCDCKIGTVTERCGIEQVSVELAALWTDDGENRYSLRELADYFNQQVLRTAMVDADMNPLKGEVENLYRLLTEDESSSGNRVEAEQQLEYEGVTVDRLRDDFVTHQTVYRHLKNCLEAEYERDVDPNTRLERDIQQIESFQNRIRVIVEEMVRRLRNADLFPIAAPRVSVDIRIFCEECNALYSPGDLLDADGCDCENE